MYAAFPYTRKSKIMALAVKIMLDRNRKIKSEHGNFMVMYYNLESINDWYFTYNFSPEAHYYYYFT